MIRSLRLRLLIGTSLSGTVILGVMAAGVYLAMSHALLSDFVGSLRMNAALVSGMLDDEDGRIKFEFDPQQMPDFVSDKSHRYFEVFRDDGSVVARSPSMQGRDFLHVPAGVGARADFKLPDGHRGLAFTMPFAISPEEHGDTDRQPAQVEIIVGEQPVALDRTLWLLAWLLTVVCAIAITIMGIVLVVVVGRCLRPVQRLAADIGLIHETELSRRLPADTVPAELVPVVDKLNGLLGRLERAFEREKAFTADVSHELRTPLAGLRSTLEVCRSRPREAAAYESALDDCRGITDRMEAMVQSLLLLARSDSGQIVVDRRPVDLAELVTETWTPYQYRAERKGIELIMDLGAGCIASTDPNTLRIVLNNLLENAVSYIDEKGRLSVATRAENSGTTIEIANSGSLIAAEDAMRLFDRFWRGDAARTHVGLNCGLGLSISKRLVELLGGEIQISTATGGDFVVRLRLPGK